MKLSRARLLFNTFTFFLIFSLHCLILAQPKDSLLPTGLNDLLIGKETDFAAVAEEIKETDLPTALAVVELLKFKATHRRYPCRRSRHHFS